MGLDVGTVDGNLVRRARQGRRQFGKQILPDAFLRPAVIAIVDRRRGAVCRRAVPPATTRLQHVNDTTDNAPVVFAPPPRRTVRQMWFDQHPLIVRKPKLILHVPKLPLLSSKTLNHLIVNEF